MEVIEAEAAPMEFAKTLAASPRAEIVPTPDSMPAVYAHMALDAALETVLNPEMRARRLVRVLAKPRISWP